MLVAEQWLKLEQALKDVCQVLKAHDPDRDWEKDAEVQQALAEKLMDLADAGVRDPRELCSRMLQSFDPLASTKPTTKKASGFGPPGRPQEPIAAFGRPTLSASPTRLPWCRRARRSFDWPLYGSGGVDYPSLHVQ